MESEGSLPFLQKLATRRILTHFNPVRIFTLCLFKIYLQYYIPSALVLKFFPDLSFEHNQFSLLPCLLHTPPLSSFYAVQGPIVQN